MPSARRPALLAERGFGEFVLLTTERAQDAAPGLAGRAAEVFHVPPGLVDELSAGLLEQAEGRPLVALGGGRVIDTAKAIAGAVGAAGGRAAHHALRRGAHALSPHAQGGRPARASCAPRSWWPIPR